MVTGPEVQSLEGGWGYLTTVAVFISHLTTAVSLSSFGIVHGKFLASLGDETTNITSATSIYTAFMCCTGLLTGYMIGKLGYQKVGLIGAVFHLIGSILLIFVVNFVQFIICLSVLQGFAGGLMLPTAMASHNEYFHKKLNMMIGIAQIFITVATIVHPPVMGVCLETIGYTNTKIALACCSLLNFFAMWSLHPVEWHTKKEGTIGSVEGNANTNNNTPKKAFDFSLLKSPKFLSIAFGVSLTFNADILFIGVFATVLRNLSYSTKEIVTLSMVHYGSDLIARIFYSVISAFYIFKNRYLFYGATFLIIIFRILFAWRTDYIWRLVTLMILGFLRCAIQTPFSLVFSEKYKENFSSAFTLFMVSSGITSIILGQLMNVAKELMDDDDVAIQILTAAMLLSVLIWSVEFIYMKFKKK